VGRAGERPALPHLRRNEIEETVAFDAPREAAAHGVEIFRRPLENAPSERGGTFYERRRPLVEGGRNAWNRERGAGEE
jgi:hypothetical protein